METKHDCPDLLERVTSWQAIAERHLYDHDGLAHGVYT